MIDSADLFGFSVLIFCCAFLLGLVIGSNVGVNGVRAEAVKANAAHYESGNDGTAVFKWGAK